MGLFKKPNRKFRQREARPDSEDESASTESSEIKPKTIIKVDVKPSTSVENEALKSSTSAKDKEDKSDLSIPKASKLLSFHDDEDDGEVFKLKKSSYSRRLAKQREKERKKKEEITILSSSSSKYQDKTYDSNDVSEGDQDKDTLKILTGNDAEDMEVDSEEEREKSNPFKNVLQSGIIPDAATIYAMKKHRQMAREMGDFIPVEDPENEDESKSRLVRDDDNDRSDDDDEPSRLSFAVNTDEADRQKMRETFLSLQKGPSTELETEDAAELDRWEREQIKKGVGVVQVGPGQTSQITETQLFSYPQSNVSTILPFFNNGSNQHPATPVVKPVPEALLKPKGVVLTQADIRARVVERLSALKTQNKANEEGYEACKKESFEQIEMAGKMIEEKPVRAAAYALYQQMSGYVKDLVECLDLKVAHIDLLDDKLLDLYKQKAQKLSLRRQMDIRDQSDEFATLSSEILKGVNVEFLSEKRNLTDDVKLRRAAEREGRRMRRRKQRERQMLGVKHHEGMSSDDEVQDIDVLRFRESKEAVLQEANSIFEDVVEEFGTLEGVMRNFETWKCEQLNSYLEAYVPLCLPKIFGAFVKLALLGWNPLEEERNFEKTRWFRQLLSYEHENYKTEEEVEDPDYNLLPSIMERIVLPKITAFIQQVWDPLSQKETFRIARFIRDFLENYHTITGKSKQLQNCLKALTVRINKALDDDVFVPLYPKELLENRSLKALDFFQRQFWASVKLLQNICYWDGIIAEQPLQQFAFGSLLNRYLLMGLSTSTMLKDTIDKCKVIVETIPRSWLANIKGDSTLPLLKQFSTFLVKYADSYYSQSIKKGVITDEIKENIKEIVQLLISLESIDNAAAVIKKYSISGFKNI